MAKKPFAVKSPKTKKKKAISAFCIPRVVSKVSQTHIYLNLYTGFSFTK